MKTTPLSDVGVIVGRFQVPELHIAHVELINSVIAEHSKVIIFLGIPRIPFTRNNPLEFTARKLMIQEHYSDVVILPIQDRPSDDDWSSELIERVHEVYPASSITLYGGRDSFIPHFTGNQTCVELSSRVYMSGTEIREVCRRNIQASGAWRAGVVYAAHNQRPRVFPTVDVAVCRNEENKPLEILVARKPDESRYRFIGGFVDPGDESLEATARREVMEEANIDITDPQYIGSFKVDDWRLRNEVDKITTTLFYAEYLSGAISPQDDICELRWVNIEELRLNIEPVHAKLAEALILGNRKKTGKLNE